jgi:hypothetical protein
MSKTILVTLMITELTVGLFFNKAAIPPTNLLVEAPALYEDSKNISAMGSEVKEQKLARVAMLRGILNDDIEIKTAVIEAKSREVERLGFTKSGFYSKISEHMEVVI